MDQTSVLLALIGATALGIVATIFMLRGQRRTAEDAERDSRFAVSTEGMKRCPNCGFGNLVTDSTCASCGRHMAD